MDRINLMGLRDFTRTMDLTFEAALNMVQERGWTICRKADGNSPAQQGLTVEQALLVCEKNPGLIYLREPEE